MFRRLGMEIVEEAFRGFPVVALVGSRQAGKTTVAKEIVRRRAGRAVYLDLELPVDVAKLDDPQGYLGRFSEKLVVLDEIQHAPGIFKTLRALVDKARRPGRFLVLGSASSDLLRQASESLAGRIQTLELPGLLIPEVAPGPRSATSAWEHLWVRGGYPESFLAPTDRRSYEWRDAFVRTLLQRDVADFGIRIPATRLRRFWTMLGHVHGQLWNANLFAENFGISAPTARSYVDLLEDLFLVRQLPPFAANVSKRLTKAHRVYVRDSGILHALLGIRDHDDLLSRPVLGASFEGFVIEQILGTLPGNVNAAFYRTATGVEVDLIITASKRRFAVEVKHTSAPRLSKGLRVAMQDIECDQVYIVTAGDERYPLSDSVEAIPVGSFLRDVIMPLRAEMLT
jgi:uncharacterized protein